MLQVFRESIGRYVAIAILALIGVTFVFFGIDFTITQTSYAAKVNGEAIPIREFERQLQNLVNQYQRELRIELTDDDRLALRREMLERMVLREVLLQSARDAGYRVSDEQLREAIRSSEAFQAGGRFSADVYRSLLAAEGLTPTGYEESQREQLTLIEFEDAILESGFMTPAEFRRFIEIYYESREVAWAEFAAADFTDSVVVDDAQLAEVYAGNESRYMTAESVDIEFVTLSLAQIADTIDISEERLREYYEEDSARYAGSEQRRVRHILFEIDGDDSAAALAEAEAARARLDAGEDFAALAAELSDDGGSRSSGGDLGFIARGVFSGPLEDAVFAMEPGTIAGPVESEFGYHLLRLEEIRAGEQPPFEAIRDDIRRELASREAFDSYYDRATDLADAAYRAGSDLASVATEFGLPLETMTGLTRNGGIERFPDPGPIIAVAFDEDAIASGESSDLIELGNDEVAIVRVVGHHLPELRPLEDVADEIRASLVDELAGELASDAAGAFVAELDPAAVAAGTQDPAALAAAHGGTWNPAIRVDRTSTELPSSMLATIFAQSKPATGMPVVTTTPIGVGDEAVILVLSAEAGDPESIPSDVREQGREQLVQQIAEGELNAFTAEARSAARVRIPDSVLDPDQ